MHPRKFSGVGGTILLVIGLLAFIPGLNTYPMNDLPPLRVEASYGYFLNILAMNVLNKLTLIAFGIAGILCARAAYQPLIKSINFSRVVCVCMGILTICGIFPGSNRLWGLAPVWGNQIWFYGIFAILGGYCGYIWPKSHPESAIDTTQDRIRPAA